MNQLKALNASATVAAVLAAPVIVAIVAALRLNGDGAFNTLDSTATLAQIWLWMAVIITLLLGGRLMANSLIDVRSRGLGAVASVSPARTLALGLAEQSHFGAGPGPDDVAPVEGLIDLAQWQAPIRTPEFAVPETPITEVVDTEADAKAAALALAMAVEEETVAVYEGPTETITANRGDTWWTLATELLDEGERWEEIAALNVGREQHDGVVMSQSTRIRAGYELVVPQITEDEESTQS